MTERVHAAIGQICTAKRFANGDARVSALAPLLVLEHMATTAMFSVPALQNAVDAIVIYSTDSFCTLGRHR